MSESREVQRYRCRNPACNRTFSILPPDVVPYSRFFWPDLLSVGRGLAAGATPYRLARSQWHVGPGVIVRARVLLNRLGRWFGELCREITGGVVPVGLEAMAGLVTQHYGRPEFVHMWYRHIYPCRY